jgi:hypothetical protein
VVAPPLPFEPPLAGEEPPLAGEEPPLLELLPEPPFADEEPPAPAAGEPPALATWPPVETDTHGAPGGGFVTTQPEMAHAPNANTTSACDGIVARGPKDVTTSPRSRQRKR